MISRLICATIATILQRGNGFMTETLILSPRFTPDSVSLRRAALEQNWQVERLNSYRIPEDLKEKQICVYGEALFTGLVAQELNHVLLEVPANWLMKVPKAYLLRDIEFSTLAEARKISEPRFIKPAEGKFFAAKVYQNGDELPPKGSQAEGMPVYMAEPVKWLKEFRCFILEGQLETFSVYSRNGELAETNDEWPMSSWPMTTDEVTAVQTFCEKILNDVQIAMPPAFVLDIGEIEGRAWAVIEANPVWASGIYGAEPAKILPLLKRSCIPADELTNKDAQWQIERYSDD
jgi:hypothetical protein